MRWRLSVERFKFIVRIVFVFVTVVLVRVVVLIGEVDRWGTSSLIRVGRWWDLLLVRVVDWCSREKRIGVAVRLMRISIWLVSLGGMNELKLLKLGVEFNDHIPGTLELG